MKSVCSTPNETVGSFRSQIGALLCLASIFLTTFMARIVFGPLMPAIERDLNISHADAGSLFFIMTFGFILSTLLSGFLCSYITHRKTIIVSAISIGIGLIIASLSQNLLQMSLSMLLLGFCAGFYMPSGFSTLTSLVSLEDCGKAIAVHELAPNMSFVVAPLFAELILKWFMWRHCIFILGLITLLIGINFVVNGKGGDFYGEKPSLQSIKKMIKSHHFISIIVLFAIGVGANIGIYSMLPLFLVVEKGAERMWANSIIGLSRISGFFMSFIAGWMTDRLGAMRTLSIVLSCTGMATIVLAMAPPGLIASLIFVQSALTVCFFPPGLAAITKFGDRQSRNLTISFQIPFAYLFGMGLFPILVGVFGDAGLFDWGISMIGAIALLGGIFCLKIK